MLSKVKSAYDGVRSSLFFLPMLFVVGAVVLGEAMLLLDAAAVDDVPRRLMATVDSARAVLSTVAGATLAFAGIAFSVSLLLISLASSQFSPRVVHGLFRDPYNKRIMGIVVGTFTYCLVVMRAVRSAVQESGESIVPSLATLLAVVLGIVSVLAIVAFINHSAHSMDVSKILHRVTEEALRSARACWPEQADRSGPAVEDPPSDSLVVTADQHGWVERIEHESLLAVLAPGSRVRLETRAGRYVVEGAPLCRVWPRPEDEDEAVRKIRGSVPVGETRTTEQDVTYGLRQLVDVALKAMSPGVNDPTTAHDAMSHAGAALGELLRRVPPPATVADDEDRAVHQPDEPTHAELVGLAFDELRVVSAGDPTVLIYLLQTIDLVTTSLDGLPRAEAVAALRRQAELVRTMNEEADLPDADLDRVREAHRALTP